MTVFDDNPRHELAEVPEIRRFAQPGEFAPPAVGKYLRYRLRPVNEEWRKAAGRIGTKEIARSTRRLRTKVTGISRITRNKLARPGVGLFIRRTEVFGAHMSIDLRGHQRFMPQ